MKLMYKYINLNFYAATSNEHLNLLLLSDGQVLTGLYFVGKKHVPILNHNYHEVQEAQIFYSTEKQLYEYINGFRQRFTINYHLQGTDFQMKVWSIMAKIQYKEMMTYQEIANLISIPKAVRAVANAISRNPISIIVPCHRIIGSNGSLTGYVGGIKLKEKLLALEQKNII